MVKKKVRATVVCTRDEHVLLVSKDGTRWALPGGRPARGEAPLDTAFRELREETSLKAKDVAFLFQFIGATTVHHVFWVKIGKAAQPKPSNEIAHCDWFKSEELLSLVASQTTKLIVQNMFMTAQKSWLKKPTPKALA